MNEILSNLLQISLSITLIFLAWRLPEIIRTFKSEQVKYKHKNMFKQEDNVFVRMIYFYALLSGGLTLGVMSGLMIGIGYYSVSIVLSFTAFMLLVMIIKVFETL